MIEGLPPIRIDLSSRYDAPPFNVLEAHTQAYESTQDSDSGVISRSAADVVVCRGAISCYFMLGFQGDTISFKHLIVSTDQENRFAMKYFQSLFPDPQNVPPTRIMMIGTTTTRTSNLVKEIEYKSNERVTEILKVNSELANIFNSHSDSSSQETHDSFGDNIPAHVSLNVLHVPVALNFDMMAMTLGQGEVVLWDENSHTPIQKFSYEELEAL